MTRGIKHLTEKFIDKLSKVMLPMYMQCEDLPEQTFTSGAKTSGAPQPKMNMVQVAVRPVQLWEIVFPKEHEDLIAASIFSKERGVTNQKWLTKWFNLLRKLLHLEPIDWDYRDKIKIDLPTDWVEVIGIGKKYDKHRKDDKNDYEAL